ncbi:Exostosin-like 1 [Armadillidium nasatum]|uniref:Exostosin-like 1 n=1 Tax=Armadillidium nasatum TaxID=96803 RepID=A0A5N5TNT7_9CRUS|nr:Exostosin-like 1 [Armadillidium nasatum]
MVESIEKAIFDYVELLRNSSFCLVPRGRRLGSFRFLEVLQAGCVPVLLANGWVLPFSEVIDWTRAAIWSDERLLLQVPDIIRSILPSQLLAMRQQTQILWTRYFSSIEKIILGHFHALGLFSFISVYGLSQKLSLVMNIVCNNIIVVWSSTRQAAPTPSRLPGGEIPITVVPDTPTGYARYQLYSSISTDAVFSLEEDALLTTEELDFGFVVWRTFPDRLVGYPARKHYWSEAKGSWTFSSRWFNSYSIILTGAAVYHRYYQHLFITTAQALQRKGVPTIYCDDILFNVVTSDVRRFRQRSTCLNSFYNALGQLPLFTSNLRLDPVLFKDKVSVQLF